jgi:hypothetical protein
MTDTVSTTPRVKIDANRPTATQVVDGDSYTAELDLTPIAAGLLNDIAVALRGKGHLMTLLANTKVGSVEHFRTRRLILARLQATRALTVTLGPDQAEALSGELWSASEEPSRCEGHCDGENYARIGNLCGDCDEAASFRNAMAGGRL